MEDVACWPDADLPLALTNVQSCKWQTLKAPRPHYQAGRSKHWIKVRNRSQPSMERVMESFGTSKKSFGSFSETYSECSDCAVSELSTGVTFVV